MLDDPALSAYFRVLGFDIDDAAWRLTTIGMCWWDVSISLKAGSPEPVMWDSPMNLSSEDGTPATPKTCDFGDGSRLGLPH